MISSLPAVTLANPNRWKVLSVKLFCISYQKEIFIYIVESPRKFIIWGNR
jgi:hypothetical protein